MNDALSPASAGGGFRLSRRGHQILQDVGGELEGPHTRRMIVNHAGDDQFGVRAARGNSLHVLGAFMGVCTAVTGFINIA